MRNWRDMFLLCKNFCRLSVSNIITQKSNVEVNEDIDVLVFFFLFSLEENIVNVMYRTRSFYVVAGKSNVQMR